MYAAGETSNNTTNPNMINKGQQSMMVSNPFTLENVNEICTTRFIDNEDINGFNFYFDVKEGDFFKSKDHLKYIMGIIAMRKNQHFFVFKSDPRRIYMKCPNKNCNWILRCYPLQNNGLWVIKSYSNIHSCERTVTTTKHPQANTNIVSKCLKSAYGEKEELEGVSPKQLMRKVQKDHGVAVTYYTALKAKDICLGLMQGSAEESYAMLPDYAECLQKENPGTYTSINITKEGKFKYFFLSFGASIEAWKHCRPVLSVDGTFLKNKYKGILIMAAAMDAENHILPVACSIVDAEDDNAWLWFFEKLRAAIGLREDLVIISDRKPSIPTAISKVYPEACQGVCTHHMYKNVLTKFKKAANEQLYLKCVWATTSTEFDHYMLRLSSIDERVVTYLKKTDPRLWTKAHCPKKRYDIMTTNISECLNGVLKAARDRPVVPVIEAYRKLCQNWMNRHRIEGASMRGKLTTKAEKRMEEQEKIARTLFVDTITNNVYEVVEKGSQYVVNLNNKTCTCNAWQLDDFPCRHSMASLWMIKNDPKDHVSIYYRRETFVATYSKGGIYPSGYKSFSKANSDSNIILEQTDQSTLPPDVRRQPGRPKKKRIPSIGEKFYKSVHCGNCNKSGHNKRSCRD